MSIPFTYHEPNENIDTLINDVRFLSIKIKTFLFFSKKKKLQFRAPLNFTVTINKFTGWFTLLAKEIHKK